MWESGSKPLERGEAVRKRSKGTGVFGNQAATARQGPEYSSSEQAVGKGAEYLGIREQTARGELEYSRSSEQTARKGLECL